MSCINGKNIILIGMPGCGKSTAGVLLAKAMGREFVDTDLLIQTGNGRLLRQIIEKEGLTDFLKLEEEVLLSIEPCRSLVVATGGSAVYSEKAMTHLKSGGIAVYLDLPFEIVQSRIADAAARGVVMEPGQTLAELYCRRVPLYRRYADLTIECGEQILEETVSSLLTAIKSHCS